MPLFKMIPAIYAGDLPDDVEGELRSWNEELCFHGDSGSVFTLSGEALERLPCFIAWMLEIGAWTKSDVDLPTYKKFETETGYASLQAVGQENYTAYFTEYHKWVGQRNRFLTVAMTGT